MTQANRSARWSRGWPIPGALLQVGTMDRPGARYPDQNLKIASAPDPVTPGKPVMSSDTGAPGDPATSPSEPLAQPPSRPRVVFRPTTFLPPLGAQVPPGGPMPPPGAQVPPQSSSMPPPGGPMPPPVPAPPPGGPTPQRRVPAQPGAQVPPPHVPLVPANYRWPPGSGSYSQLRPQPSGWALALTVVGFFLLILAYTVWDWISVGGHFGWNFEAKYNASELSGLHWPRQYFGIWRWVLLVAVSTCAAIASLPNKAAPAFRVITPTGAGISLLTTFIAVYNMGVFRKSGAAFEYGFQMHPELGMYAAFTGFALLGLAGVICPYKTRSALWGQTYPTSPAQPRRELQPYYHRG